MLLKNILKKPIKIATKKGYVTIEPNGTIPADEVKQYELLLAWKSMELVKDEKVGENKEEKTNDDKEKEADKKELGEKVGENKEEKTAKNSKKAQAPKVAKKIIEE